ncbi:MAG: peptidyl-prolyl cis-trans isomerase [Candidatus Aminicenantes bacterium]|nr:peptidyl-prolyl cis-trans isomerase [Candidatus Aminicenantes bacterium]
MLKSMRRNFKSFAPALWLVIITFIVALFIWVQPGDQGGEAGDLGDMAVARVGRETITADQYASALQQAIAFNEERIGEMSKEIIQQINLPNQVLQELIRIRLLLQAAEERRVTVSDREFQEQVLSRFPVFLDQKTGRFVGQEEYEDILTYYKISIAEFEKSIADAILLEKIQDLLTAGVSVTPEEVRDHYRRENETARIEYLLLETNTVELPEPPGETEIEEHFNRHKERFRIPEQRSGTAIFLNREDLKKEVEFSAEEIEQYYRDNLDQFQNPEETRLSRIHIPYGGRAREDVRSDLGLLKERLEKGEDFGLLAQAHSRDSKASQGGDWGAVEWRSLPEKEQEAIAGLASGQMSEIVETDEGMSLLKVTQKTPASPIPLEDARSRIETVLEDQKAQSLAAERIGRLAKEAKKDNNLGKAAERLGLKAVETGALKEGDPMGVLDPSGVVSQALFQLEEKGLSEVLYTYQGVGLAQLLTVIPSHPATLEEVRDEVLDEVVEAKKKSIILDRIRALRGRLAEGRWDNIGAEAALEYRTVNEHKRGQYLSTVGESEEVDLLAFSLPLKAVSEPVEFETGYLVLRVLERKQITPQEFAEKESEARSALLDNKRNLFLGSLLAKDIKEKGVRVEYNNFLQVVSTVLGRFEEKEE